MLDVTKWQYMDVYLAMCNTVYHSKFDVSLPLSERLTAEILYHLGGAVCCAVVIFDESCYSALYRFQLLVILVLAPRL